MLASQAGLLRGPQIVGVVEALLHVDDHESRGHGGILESR